MRLPKQKNIPYLGGLWTLIGYLAFIFSFVNTLFITVITYSTSERARIIFPSYWIFLSSYLIFGFFMTYLCYKYVIPSTLTFQQEQSVLDNRNPLYDKVCKIEEIVKELKK